MANTFEAVALQWIDDRLANNTEATRKRREGQFRKHLFPMLGARPIADITSQELLAALKKTEKSGTIYTANKLLATCKRIYKYAIAANLTQVNIAANLDEALKPHKTEHFPAITKPVELGKLLKAINHYDGTFPVKCALKLAPYFFVRPGELRTAEWTHFDFENRTWEYVCSKTGRDHIVPLAKQAIDILKELHFVTGHGRHVFPSIRARNGSRCMSDNTLNAALRRLGYEPDQVTAHGFRATARTILDEKLNYRMDIIKHQLAHEVKDPNGRAYNRTTHLPKRMKMMQAWADYLDSLCRNSP